jgi:hypothetical protein
MSTDKPDSIAPAPKAAPPTIIEGLSHLAYLGYVNAEGFKDWAYMNPGGVCQLVRALVASLPDNNRVYFHIYDSLNPPPAALPQPQSAATQSELVEDAEDHEVRRDYYPVADDHKWPRHDGFFIKQADMAPMRGHNGRGGDSESPLPSFNRDRYATPPPPSDAAQGYTDHDRARIVSALQSARDRMAKVLPKVYGEGFDGDLDTMLDAINYMKKCRAHKGEGNG